MEIVTLLLDRKSNVNAVSERCPGCPQSPQSRFLRQWPRSLPLPPPPHSPASNGDPSPTSDKEAADVITISALDMLVKAAALAMKQVPDVNASWMDTFIRRYDQVDINLIMSTGEDSVSPVIRDVAAKGLSTLAKETAQCEHVLFDASTNQPAVDMNTGTFSIHNLGQYGVKAVSPIVLPPQACALGLGAISDTVLPNYDNNDKDSDKVYRVAPVVVATLSCDHRVVDGAVGAQWLAAFKQLVENPLAMMVM
mmetsp:Transcript_13943/g.18990  ORF Transcript_13943/g.18990 Transcript_13943/m.18990 type:complete len:252 (-) Transcript_13943:209-964(-)